MSFVSAIKDCITNTAGDATDLTKVMGLVAFTVYIVATIYTVFIAHQPFAYEGFGIGLGAVIGACGAAIRLDPNNANQEAARTAESLSNTVDKIVDVVKKV